MKILLVAEESAGIRLLNEVAKLPHEVVAVMAAEPPGASSMSCVWNTARKLGYETWPAALVKKAELAERVRRAGVDIILNVHSLFIIHPAVLLSPKIGAFNLHPGPLPQFAGLNAPSWAIYRGEKKHGVTLHKMEPGIDTGAIIFEETFEILDTDTGLSVALRCVQLGVPLILKLLDIASKDPELIPSRLQDVAQRKYFGREVPQGGAIMWNRPARQIFNFIRASDYTPFDSPWGRPQTKHNGRQVFITKSALTGQKTNDSPGSIMLDRNGVYYVSCSDEWLEIRKVFNDGRNSGPSPCLTAGGRLDVF